MTIARAFGTKGLGDEVSHGEINDLADSPTFALDRRSGQTDTLASIVTLSGAGRIIGKYAAGADADTTYLVSGSNSIIDAGTLTANRAYTLGNTNAAAGDVLSLLNRSGFYITVKDNGGTTLIVLGAQMQSNGESVWADLLFNGTAWVLWKSSLRPTLGATTFTANGTYVVPRGVTQLLVIGWGGGGGGGGGSPGSVLNANSSTGGGGGGGSQQGAALVTSSGGTSITVTVGAGGIVVVATSAGTDGSPSTFGSLASFAGAGGGTSTTSSGNSVACAAYGGAPVALNSAVTSAIYLGRTVNASLVGDAVQILPGSGGRSLNQVGIGSGLPSVAGTPSVQGFAGGAGGTFGATNTGTGGGGGGGGGGGPGGVGGNAGAGGAGNGGGPGLTGSAGSSAAANTGAGGGGGGGGGSATAGGGTGGSGGAGGSGQIAVIPLR